MENNPSGNKRIAKNTLLLYFRMLLTILVGLYTSRVVLNTLGISDYGVYNIVGGVVTMLAFLNSAMVAASPTAFAKPLALILNVSKEVNSSTLV